MATGLAGPGQAHGADVDEFCDTVFPLLTGAHAEVGFGPTATPDFVGQRAAEQRAFDALAARFDVPVWGASDTGREPDLQQPQAVP
ncbi:hypothetical protein GCM10029964_047200 [Kibdelosporangium lantanae]